MLVQVRSVEIAKPVDVPGKVRGHPIEDHSNIVLVHHVDEIGKVLGSSVSGRRGEIAHGLITPTAVERIFTYWHKLNMSKPHFREIARKLVCKLSIAEEAAAAVHGAFPGAQVAFVDQDRLVEPLTTGSRGHPFVVGPLEIGDVPDNRGGFGAKFGVEAVGVGLLDQVAVGSALDFKFVHFSLREVRDEELPDSRGASVAHRVPAAVPMVEVADHAHPHGVGRPDREVDAAEALVIDQVRT